ncbi:hypothetical protein GGF38_002022 [Coemansia sp. RSA 25]|nr:hypothetical protein GGF38_002022 [Coemansia sp. RSA 25]
MAPKHFAPVWQHYDRHEPTGRSKHHRAICKFCKYELSGQPERMKTHLQRCSNCPADIKDEFAGEEGGGGGGGGGGGENGGYMQSFPGDDGEASPHPPSPKRRRMSAEAMEAVAAAAVQMPPPFAAVYESVRGYYSRVTPIRRAALAVAVAGRGRGRHAALREALGLVPRAVGERFYGCGEPLPAGIEGLRVVDLGCGAGRDCYAAARLVGPAGEVIGVDMTDEQLRVARGGVGEFARALGYTPHLRFVKGYIEFLGQVPGLFGGSIDLCISNSAVNLSPNKELVLRGVFDVLREGGEFQFADIYADRRLPPHVRSHPALLGESLGGALYTEDFRRLCQRVGFADVRMARAPARVRIDAPDVRELVGATRFHSITFRLFKFARPQAALEPTREDYGQVAVYRGTIQGQPARVRLDAQWAFEAQRPVLVDGNTALMLGESWLRRHFDVRGDRSHHFGAFAQPGSSGSLQDTYSDDDDGDDCDDVLAPSQPLPHPPHPPPPPPMSAPSSSNLAMSDGNTPSRADAAGAELLQPLQRSALPHHPASFPRLSSFSISQSNVRADMPASAAARQQPPPPPPPLQAPDSFASSPRFVMPASRIGSSYNGQQQASPAASSSLPRILPPASSGNGRSPISSILMSVSPPRHHSPAASVATAASTT